MAGRDVLIVGTGLIGTSVGLALAAAGNRVTGYDADPARAERAAAHASFPVDSDLAAAAGADTIVVATPVGQIIPAVRSVVGHASDGVVVTDVGSTKGTIVSAAETILGDRGTFVGGHPMAGTEGEGAEAARADLFTDALWILTPTGRTDPGAYARVNELVRSVGARTLAIDPEEHDRLVARVSHLPYAVATTLMVLAGRDADPKLLQAAAGTFRDVTRTAGSNPIVWLDIMTTNREAVLEELDRLCAGLGDLRAALDAQRWDEVRGLLAEAGRARAKLPIKGERDPSDPYLVDLLIPDRTGVLAEVTRTVGDLGINIEDLRMHHTGSGGQLELTVDGGPAADRAASALRDRGYTVTTRPAA